MWGWNAYTMRLECLQHEAWRYAAWGLKIYSMTVYEAWKYTLWGLKVYTIRPECIQHEAWKYTLWGLNVCSIMFESIHYDRYMRAESIQYAASKYNSIRPGSLQYEFWKYTVWLYEVSFMDLLNISYYSIKCVWIGSCLNCCLVLAPEEVSKELKSLFGDI